MSKIFFNDRAVKTLPETTILNWFTQSDGKTIFIRDTRGDIYKGRDFIYAEIDTYSMSGDMYVDFLPQKIMDGTIMGLFIAEGSDFQIETLNGREPVFVVRQKATAMSLGMRPMMNKGILVTEVAMGMFFEGTTISYSRDGETIKDKLTKKGWERIGGASDLDLSILSTEDVFNRKNTLESELMIRKKDKLAELKEALSIPGVNTAALKSIIASKEDTNINNTHFILLSDIKELVSKKIL